MKSRSRILVLAVVALLPGGFLLAKDDKAKKTLAHRLPADTIFYTQTNVPSLLGEADKYLKFVDAEEAKGLVRELKTMHEILKEIGAEYEFEPILFDKIFESDLYVIVNTKTKPKVTVRKVTRRNFQTGESEEKTETETENHTVSVVIETTPEVAKDFLKQFKGLVERLKEKHPDKDGYGGYKELDIDEGELLAVGRDKFTLGRRDRYLVVSSDKPEKLWTALDSSPDTSLVDTELFQRYDRAKPSSLGLCLLNLEALLLQAEASLKQNLTDAKQRRSNGEDSGDDEEGAPPQGGFDQKVFDEKIAEQSLKSFLAAKEIFSLDQVKTLGGNLAWETAERESHSRARMDLLLGEKISPVLRQILDGGQRFQLPPLGKLDHLCIFLRTGLSKILEGIVAGLDETTSQQFQQSMMIMKGVVGHTAGEIFDHLAGDLYFLVDIKEKEHETQDFDEKSGKFITKTVVGPMPELFLLLGVKDREAFSNVLSDVITRLSSGPFAPTLGKFISQRVYQGIDVYLVGQGLDLEGNDPNGLTSYAMVVVDRYLTFGSWKEVTAMIRRAKAADKGANRKLAAIVGEHKKSNLLIVAPSSWSKKMQKMSDKADDDVWDEVIDEMVKDFLELSEDEEVKTRFKDAFKRADRHLKALSEKGQDLAVDPAVGDGGLSGTLYEAKANFDYRKPGEK